MFEFVHFGLEQLDITLLYPESRILDQDAKNVHEAQQTVKMNLKTVIDSAVNVFEAL